MRIFIVSDFHLKFNEKLEDKERLQRVLEFLTSLENKADMLILNGDIFDLWYAWNSVIIRGYFPILKKLSELQEKGVRLVMTAGNHDFWFKDFLTKEIGVEVYPKSFVEVLDGNNIFVNHGDWFTANDWRYKLFRSLVRNKLVMKFFELLHADIALGIGKMLSRSSRDRKMAPKLKQRKESGLVKFAKKALDKYDIVVLGHSHSPKLEKYKNGIYVNSGDWIEHNSYIKITDGKLELLEFKTKEK